MPWAQPRSCRMMIVFHSVAVAVPVTWILADAARHKSTIWLVSKTHQEFALI